jgi:hypothetical protein
VLYPQIYLLVLIYVTDRENPVAMVWLEDISELKISVTSSELRGMTFQPVA